MRTKHRFELNCQISKRINICRAIYCAADVQIFNVSVFFVCFLQFADRGPPGSPFRPRCPCQKSVLHQVFVNNPDGQTRILVTHALHFLPQVDCILTIADGQIMECGTHAELMENNHVFSKFVKEFGSREEEHEDADEIAYEVEAEYEGKGCRMGLKCSQGAIREGQDDHARRREEDWFCNLEGLQELLCHCKRIHSGPRSPTLVIVDTGCPGHVRLLACVLARTTVPQTLRVLRACTVLFFFYPVLMYFLDGYLRWPGCLLDHNLLHFRSDRRPPHTVRFENPPPQGDRHRHAPSLLFLLPLPSPLALKLFDTSSPLSYHEG